MARTDFSSRSFRFSHSASQRKGWRLLKTELGKMIQGRSILQVLLAAGVAWVITLLLVWLSVFWVCGSPQNYLPGHCKKNRLYIMFGALGLLPKHGHRCSIPLLDDPHGVKIPASRHEDQYPLNLTYIEKDPAIRADLKATLFGGYQTWQQREDSFQIKPRMEVHCGFVGNSGGDLDDEDKKYVKKCRFVVASGIFDAYDTPHQPSNVSLLSKKLFCFLMVVDEESLKSIEKVENLAVDKNGGKYAGLWRLIVFRNSPYDEPRRNGKVPKLLTHRLFPETEYSIWIDGKMELLVDPLLLLERYLWRKGHKFAIACHKHHRSIYDEADANKRRKRYARPLIDKHMQIYSHEGMEPWSPKKLPLLSDVPEGAIIIRQHTPLTNLFCCLWFNEVNRFTPRDQLSFGYVVYRLNSSFPFFMFPNCEYNSLFLLHKHTREHSSKIEWVKSLDELKDKPLMVESRGGIGLFVPYLVDDMYNSSSHIRPSTQE